MSIASSCNSFAVIVLFFYLFELLLIAVGDVPFYMVNVPAQKRLHKALSISISVKEKLLETSLLSI